MAGYSCKPVPKMRSLIFLGFLAVALGVNAQQGFVSIDCGMDGSTSYNDTVTGITYDPDAKYINSGVNYKVNKAYLKTATPVQAETLRSFPNGSRNCYTINGIIQGDKYLIRGLFFHGNYDGLTTVAFELHLGMNFWQLVNITEPSDPIWREIITVAQNNSFSVCLVNIKSGTPFISALELRHIDSTDVYIDVNQTNSLVLYVRVNMGAAAQDIRYPDDAYDRIWRFYITPPVWSDINSSQPIQTSPGDAFQVPAAVMATAVTPANGTSLGFFIGTDTGVVYYVYMHFAEFNALSQTKSRIFDVFVNDELKASSVKPEYLLSTHISLSLTSALRTDVTYNLTLNSTSGSSFPPILNAIEVYSALPLQ
ncbi:receptor-like serine threonine-protein kinase [Musa troglodytarum]|uniref:Receptor-like serine threonine-protein kinase n=1 Tax=Musa troglodytarum TaxID=320322 RepID=A0A9E7F652_9LILI|nr:receptor-like serine threonine-protein kinase [Musa troglodytarum]